MNTRRITAAVLYASAAIVAASRADEIRIVVPPGQENRESEGAISRAGSVREQTVYPATDFAAAPDTHRTIVGYALRPDQSIVAPTAITYQDVQLRLSTSAAAPDSMSNQFADNVGPDETLVYAGDLALSTQAAGPPGGPHEFDMLVMFQTPFTYNPSLGNLLVDFRALGSEGGMTFDAHQPDRSVRLVHGGASSPTAMSTGRGIYVRRFVIAPEPSAMGLYVLGAWAAAGLFRPRRTG